MSVVEGGTFLMGSSKSEANRDGNECPHTVTVNPFSIGQYEVTQADWRAVMASNPPGSSFGDCDQCPVQNVSWNDIQEFLQELNAKHPGKTYRLPTEAEWEYAARGGIKSKGYLYAGSQILGDVAWYDRNSNARTQPVGRKLPNELGLYDMNGNVWEWCQDSWKPYPNCSGTALDEYHVVRGGSWNNSTKGCRIAGRLYSKADSHTPYVGFRLALW